MKTFISGTCNYDSEKIKWRLTDNEDMMPPDFQLCAEVREGDEWNELSEEDGDFVYRAAVQQLVDEGKIQTIGDTNYIFNSKLEDPFTGDNFEARVSIKDGSVLSEATMDDGTWVEVSDMVEYIDSLIYHQILVDYFNVSE